MKKSKVYELTDEEFIKLIKESKNFSDCLEKLELTSVGSGSRAVIKRRINELKLDISHFTTPGFKKGVAICIPLEEILVENSTYQKSNALLKRLINANLKEYKCEKCGCDGTWMGKPITLQLHHKNGKHYDNRLENLQILCPNCHTQTDTYGNKNKNHDKKIKTESKKQYVIESKCPSYEKLKELSEKHTVSEIADIFDVSRSTIDRWLKKNNLQAQQAIHKEIPLEVLDLYKNGKSIKEISILYHIDTSRISKFIKNNISELKTKEKPIIQKTKDGKIIKEWKNMSFAASELGFKCAEKLGMCANRKRKTAYGFVWEWVNP